MPITGLDIVVLVFMAISGLLALARGFTREMFSVVPWIVAAGAAIVLGPRYQDLVRQSIQPNWLADGVLFLGIFLVTLLVISFITVKLSDRILDSRVGALDRTLGFLFGVVRGVVLVAIAYMFYTLLAPASSHPTWISASKSRPLLDYTSDILRGLLPSDPDALISDITDGGGRAPKPAQAPQNDGGVNGSDANEAATGAAGSGYDRNERQQLDQLLQSTGEQRP